MTRTTSTIQDPIAIIGAGDHAKVVVSTLGARNIKPCAIFDDAAENNAFQILGQTAQKIPTKQWWRETTPNPTGHIAIGNNQARLKLSQDIPAISWATIIHPTATIHESAKIGHGDFISARAIIQPDAIIGDHTIINTGAIIEHDCKVGSFCHVAPSVTLCGNTHIAQGAMIGVGSVTIPNIKIGAWALVGAGSTIVRDVTKGATVFGNPARHHRNS